MQHDILKLHPSERGSFRRINDPVYDETATLKERAKARRPGSDAESISWLRQHAEILKNYGVEYWRNSRYLVQILNAQAVGTATFDIPKLLWLRVYRHDGGLISRHWRELQRIKNELVHPEALGVEFYPPDRLLQDGENSYHLWVFADTTSTLPFGFTRHARTPDRPAHTSTRFVQERQ